MSDLFQLPPPPPHLVDIEMKQEIYGAVRAGCFCHSTILHCKYSQFQKSKPSQQNKFANQMLEVSGAPISFLELHPDISCTVRYVALYSNSLA
jgi:hypothetical protein